MVREMAPNALITAQEVEVVQSGAPFKEGLPDVKVSEVMRREVATVHPDSPITQVVELLLHKGLHRRAGNRRPGQGRRNGQRQ